MLLIVFSLGAYFVLAASILAWLMIPTVRATARANCQRTVSNCRLLVRQVSATGDKFVNSVAYNSKFIAQELGNSVPVFSRWVVLATVLLTALPIGALVWRNWYALETFDHTAAYIKDERVSALLAGERLMPPAALPPEVFMTREVAAAKPLARYASRDWMLLDAEFRQRVLTVYRIMQERHGYEMVLLEGYRSSARQAQLASLGSHVTQAGPGRSYHQYGLAVDSAFLRDGKVVISEQDPWAMRGYQLYGETAALLGMTWGGSWKGLADYGHIELRRPNVMQASTAEGRSPVP